MLHCSDFDQAFSDPNKTEIATKILTYAKQATGREVPLEFQQTINYKIKTGDMRALQFSPGSSPQPVMNKSGKTVQISVAPGLDPNTDTTPSAWKAKLERMRQGYSGPTQIKSQIAAVRAQKGEMSSYDQQIANAGLSPRGHEEQPQAAARPMKKAVKQAQIPAAKNPMKKAVKKAGKVNKAGVKKGVKKGGGGGMKKAAKKGGAGPKKQAAKGFKKAVKKMPGKAAAPPKAVPALPQAEALYDYDAQAEDEMSFRAGEMLSVLQQDPSGWWQCRNSQGTEGWTVRNMLCSLFGSGFSFFSLIHEQPATYLKLA